MLGHHAEDAYNTKACAHNVIRSLSQKGPTAIIWGSRHWENGIHRSFKSSSISNPAWHDIGDESTTRDPAENTGIKGITEFINSLRTLISHWPHCVCGPTWWSGDQLWSRRERMNQTKKRRLTVFS